jgi:predicted dehydrogenase
MSRSLLVIGAGNIFQNNHYPVLKELNAEVVAVVEPSAFVVNQLITLLPAGVKYYNTLTDVDFTGITHALIATPAGLHYDAAKFLADKNVHVLCEKPITINTAQAKELQQLYTGKVLQIGFQRRFMATSIKIKEFIENKTYGNLSHINIWAGWVAKGNLPQSILNKQLSGGGISLDYGIHFVDLMLYWSNGLELEQYLDDSQGGIEVNSVTFAKLKFGGVVNAGLKMYQSWTNQMANSIQLYFDDALIAIGVNTPTSIQVVKINNQLTDIRFAFKTEVIDLTEEAGTDALTLQWQEFFARSERKLDEAKAVSSLADAVAAVEFVENCYNNKQQLDLNWGV